MSLSTLIVHLIIFAFHSSSVTVTVLSFAAGRRHSGRDAAPDGQTDPADVADRDCRFGTHSRERARPDH